ncbi:MAG: TetR/AcrR family transcriptional regulator [Gammaproteobacteria bacterium]|nr:MAG: TetR/AcrR family transcriptional regulator [Gammaproteobacteria bacterium]
MTTASRKQRELYEREQLILDTAQHILNIEGTSGLTMERIAAEIEYSKGTIYNHFATKEDIIGAISCRCMINLVELFSRAAHYCGSNRDRISAIGIAHSLYAQLHPVEVQNLQIIKSRDVRERISKAKQEEILQLEQRVTGIALNIIKDAMIEGDIPADEHYAPDGILLGLWSMGYGSNLLHLSDIPFEKLGMRSPLELAWINSNKLLDSYRWRPLSHDIDLNQLYQKLSTELYYDELQQLK